MKLYDFAAAPNPRRVRIFIAEKGIDVAMEQVDLRAGAHLEPDFAKINPWLTVPVLELDDGTRIAECVAISRYFEEIHPEPPLWGRGPAEIAQVEMWQHHCEIEGFFGVRDALRNSAERLKGRAMTGPADVEQIPALAERGRRQVEHFIAELDERLADNEFVAGETFSIADITAFCAVDFAAWVKVGITDDQPHAKRWYDAINARPSAQA
jgi:glutathione S-transferase